VCPVAVSSRCSGFTGDSKAIGLDDVSSGIAGAIPILEQALSTIQVVQLSVAVAKKSTQAHWPTTSEGATPRTSACCARPIRLDYICVMTLL
jgi:hypothetical protein